jgi:hypothetical protein
MQPNTNTATFDAHPRSNIVQMAEGIRTGVPPTNTQINTELEATKAYLNQDMANATTAKEEKAMYDARKLVEAAQTTLIAKNSDEKIQQLAAAMSTMSANDDTQFGGNRSSRRQYNKLIKRLRDISLAFGNSPSFRAAFLDLIHILRDIFNVAASNSGLTGANLRDNLRQQLGNLRTRAQQPGWAQTGYGSSGTNFQPGYSTGTTGHLAGQPSLLSAQPGYSTGTTGHLTAQPGFGSSAGTSLLPGQPGYVAPSTAGTTGILPGQPGYIAPSHQSSLLAGNQTGYGQSGYSTGNDLLNGQNLSDIVPEEQRIAFRQQLKQFLHEANAQPETRSMIEELFKVWGSLNVNLYSYWDQFQANTAGTNIPATAKAVVEEFTGDRTIDDFLEYLRYCIILIDNDALLGDYLRECRDFLLMALDDPELIDNDDYYNQGVDLLQRGRHVTARYNNEAAFVGLFEEARLIAEEIKNDATLNLLKDRTGQFVSNFVYKDPRTNTPKVDFALIDKMRANLVPFIIERIREIPMPRIEVQNKDFEYLIIDDLHLLLGNILPDQVTIHSRSLAKLAAEAQTTLNAIDANAPSTRVGTAVPEHVRGNVGDTNVHIKDDSRVRHRHDYDSSDDDSSSDDEGRPTQVRVGGRDVTSATYAGTPGHSTVPTGANIVHTTGTVAPLVVTPHSVLPVTTAAPGYNTAHTTAVPVSTVAPVTTAGGVPVTTAGTVPVTTAGAVPVAAAGANSSSTAPGAGSRIRFRIANIKPEFRNFYFSMKKNKFPAITDEGRMNMAFSGKGLTIVGAFSLIQNAAGLNQIAEPRIRISMSRVKFDILEAKHRALLKLGFLFMGRTIQRQIENSIQQRLEKLIIEWADVLNQKVIPHLPPIDQINQKGTEIASNVTNKVIEKTA